MKKNASIYSKAHRMFKNEKKKSTEKKKKVNLYKNIVEFFSSSYNSKYSNSHIDYSITSIFHKGVSENNRRGVQFPQVKLFPPANTHTHT